MRNEIRTLDLFSGIGGFALGLRRAGGFKTVAYCEINPFCQQVLQARMLDGSLDLAPIWDDVTKFDGTVWRGCVDLICGGFPCQDISAAGHKVGIEGERSGLWKEYSRIIGEVRPRYVFVENVSNLLTRGLGVVLGDLATLGYDAEWDSIPAAALGAPHLRDRVWILAYPRQEHGGDARGADEEVGRHYVLPEGTDWETSERCEHRELVALVPGVHQGVAEDWWRRQSRMDRSANGVPDGVDRIGALGNAVVPQVVEWIGRRIMKHSTGER